MSDVPLAIEEEIRGVRDAAQVHDQHVHRLAVGCQFRRPLQTGGISTVAGSCSVGMYRQSVGFSGWWTAPAAAQARLVQWAHERRGKLRTGPGHGTHAGVGGGWGPAERRPRRSGRLSGAS
jgi:hypothetical protein